jgi:hypothetical protein
MGAAASSARADERILLTVAHIDDPTVIGAMTTWWPCVTNRGRVAGIHGGRVFGR